MSWIDHIFTFKQEYLGGYRYLDKCGEFLIKAENTYGFIPNEIKPQGGNLQLPEESIDVQIDPKMFQIHQENPKGHEVILEKSMIISDLFLREFRPFSVERNIVNMRSYWPIHTVEGFDRTLKISKKIFWEEEKRKADFEVLSDKLGMVPSYKCDSYGFKSGSKDLLVNLNAFTFTSSQVRKFNAAFQSSDNEKKRFERINKRSERHIAPPPYGIMLELVLKEDNPPEDGIKAIFDDAFGKLKLLKEMYTL